MREKGRVQTTVNLSLGAGDHPMENGSSVAESLVPQLWILEVEFQTLVSSVLSLSHK